MNLPGMRMRGARTRLHLAGRHVCHGPAGLLHRLNRSGAHRHPEIHQINGRLRRANRQHPRVHAVDHASRPALGTRRIDHRSMRAGDFRKIRSRHIEPSVQPDVRRPEQQLLVKPVKIVLLLRPPADRQLQIRHSSEGVEREVQSLVHHPVAAHPQEPLFRRIKIPVFGPGKFVGG